MHIALTTIGMGEGDVAVLDQLQDPALVSTMMVLQLSWNMPCEPPPKAKTAAAMSAAMPARSNPYSTADAPVSSRARTRRRREARPRSDVRDQVS